MAVESSARPTWKWSWECNRFIGGKAYETHRGAEIGSGRIEPAKWDAGPAKSYQPNHKLRRKVARRGVPVRQKWPVSGLPPCWAACKSLVSVPKLRWILKAWELEAVSPLSSWAVNGKFFLDRRSEKHIFVAATHTQMLFWLTLDLQVGPWWLWEVGTRKAGLRNSSPHLGHVGLTLVGWGVIGSQISFLFFLLFSLPLIGGRQEPITGLYHFAWNSDLKIGAFEH